MSALPGAPALLALLVAGPTLAADLTKVDRTLKKEPVYLSNSPRYGLLVFGPMAETRVLLVLDLGEPWDKDSSKNILYVDCNGDGDLTGPDERVACTLRRQETRVSFSPEPSVTYSPLFEVGDIFESDGKTRHTGLKVRVDSYVQ